MSIDLSQSESAIAWAFSRFGGRDALVHLAPLTRAQIVGALDAGIAPARPTPHEQLLLHVGADRTALTALRRELPAHWRVAVDRAVVNKTNATTVDHAVVAIVIGRANPSSAPDLPAELLDILGDPESLQRFLQQLAHRAWGVAVSGVEGRALARALLGLPENEREAVLRGRATELGDDARRVVTEAFVSLTTRLPEPRDLRPPHSCDETGCSA